MTCVPDWEDLRCLLGLNDVLQPLYDLLVELLSVLSIFHVVLGSQVLVVKLQRPIKVINAYSHLLSIRQLSHLLVEMIWKRRQLVHAFADLVTAFLLALPVGAGHLRDDGGHLGGRRVVVWML